MTDTKQNQPDAPEAGTAGGSSDAAGAAPENTFTPEMLTELVAKAAKAEENWERYVRATAELDNLKKRFAREKQDAIRYANEDLLERLIPVLDNFDMAVAAVSNPQANSLESIRVGINMILTQLKGTITEAGLEEIDARGQAFNPNFHEAVSQQESADAPEGQVLQQMRKGYKLRDRLLRPASVVVSKKPGA